jgi:cytochrome c peroxidase
MVTGFANLLSAQTMFPVLSADEMAGHYSENDVSRAVRSGRITGDGGAWDIIAHRVRSIPDYQSRFEAAYPRIAAGRPVDFTDISNAISAFVAFEWRSDTSLFDAALRGQTPLSGQAAKGADLFFGEAGCATCHSGPLLSDFGYHAMGQPQLGPGKAERFENHQRDVGRMRVTGNPADAYRFRTPSLRNTTKTGPWGHAGAFTDLSQFLAHHAGATRDLTPGTVTLPGFQSPKALWTVLETPADRDAILAVAEPGQGLQHDQIAAIVAFLQTLEDETALAGRLGIPDSVPSGLQVDR